MIARAERYVAFLLVLKRLTFFSARARFRHCVDELCEALIGRFDPPRIYNLAVRIILLSGEVVLLQLAVNLLG